MNWKEFILFFFLIILIGSAYLQKDKLKSNIELGSIFCPSGGK